MNSKKGSGNVKMVTVTNSKPDESVLFFQLRDEQKGGADEGAGEALPDGAGESLPEAGGPSDEEDMYERAEEPSEGAEEPSEGAEEPSKGAENGDDQSEEQANTEEEEEGGDENIDGTGDGADPSNDAGVDEGTEEENGELDGTGDGVRQPTEDGGDDEAINDKDPNQVFYDPNAPAVPTDNDDASSKVMGFDEMQLPLYVPSLEEKDGRNDFCTDPTANQAGGGGKVHSGSSTPDSSTPSTTSLLASGNLYLTMSKIFMTEVEPNANINIADVLMMAVEELRKLNTTLTLQQRASRGNGV